MMSPKSEDLGHPATATVCQPFRLRLGFGAEAAGSVAGPYVQQRRLHTYVHGHYDAVMRVRGDSELSFTDNFCQGASSMSDHVFKKIEVTGTSTKGQDDAINNALTKAAETVKNMRWFEVVESRGNIKDGKVDEYQVTMKIGFRLAD